MKIISSKGVSKFTTAEIAKEVGISEAAIFKYFRNKHEILYSALEFIQQSLLGKAHEIANETAADPRQKLAKLLRFHLSLIEQSYGIPQLIFSEQLHMGDENLRKRIAGTIESYLDILKNIFRQILDNNSRLVDVDFEMLATAFLGLIQVNLLRWSLSDCEYSLQDEFEKMWGFIEKNLLGPTG